MKDSKNINLFFLIAAILFWNPLTVHLLYAGSDIYRSFIFKLLFWILTAAGLFLIILVKGKKISSEKLLNLVFGISFFGILFGIIVLVNALLGFVPGSGNAEQEQFTKKTNGLLFEPNSVAHYHTAEFNYKAEINSLGLRNKEISVQKKEGVYRILCIGDSWTYGWGVNIENSWPMQLENYLHGKGFSNIEVINCGKPGMYTSPYKACLSELIPLLKPDMVLVGVLQLDDLAQLYENQFFTKKTESAPVPAAAQFSMMATANYFLSAFSHASFGNYFRLAKNKKEQTHPQKEIDIKKEWAQEAASLIAKFNYLQKLRFSTFPDTVQKLFKSGDLNASLLDIYINYPDRLSVFNDPSNPATLFALQKMNEDIRYMKQLSDLQKVKMIFLNLPINDFSGHQVKRTASDILAPFWMANNKIDSMYRSIASRNGVPYLQLTENFIQLKEKNAYFFLFDGHPNEKGYYEIARGVGDYLLREQLKKE